MTGLIAAFLIEAEMTGVPAISFRAILDQHFITKESLIAFKPIVRELIGLNDINMDNID
jgi:hypothetical protein